MDMTSLADKEQMERLQINKFGVEKKREKLNLIIIPRSVPPDLENVVHHLRRL